MSLRIRFQYPTGNTLGYSVERLADGLFYDFADSTFRASPATLTAPLPEDTGPFLGRYKVTLTTPPAQFTDGTFAVTVHDTAAGGVVGELAATLHNGDDAPVFPGVGGTGGTDPLASPVPGSYAPGTAGYALGHPTLTGYKLAADGLDAVAVETGLNARQALQLLAAADSGVETVTDNGNGTFTVVFKGVGTTTARITATCDAAGQRTALTTNVT